MFPSLQEEKVLGERVKNTPSAGKSAEETCAEKIITLCCPPHPHPFFFFSFFSVEYPTSQQFGHTSHAMFFPIFTAFSTTDKY